MTEKVVPNGSHVFESLNSAEWKTFPEIQYIETIPIRINYVILDFQQIIDPLTFDELICK